MVIGSELVPTLLVIVPYPPIPHILGGACFAVACCGSFNLTSGFSICGDEEGNTIESEIFLLNGFTAGECSIPVRCYR